MNLLQIVQRFCERSNVPSPATVYGSTDPQITQIKALFEEVGIDANSRATWQAATFQKLHTTIAAEDQGEMSTIVGSGWGYMKNLTIWDRDRRLPVIGPLTGVEWQAMKALQVNGPQYTFRIRGDNLLVNPTPPAGETWAFEYGSKNWILAVDGVTDKEYFTADTDTPVIWPSLLLMGLRAWWKKEKGFEYAEDMRMYETMLKDASSRDGGKPVLHMDEAGSSGPKPGIWVPQWSWDV